MKKWLGAIGIILLTSLVSGCATQSDSMKVNTTATYAPTKDKALIVFLRPSLYGGAIQATVHDVTGNNDHFIGIVSAKTKTAYLVEPGKKLFMVVGENADFMDATLEAGKTYYALVSPRMGLWKARFSLLPIHYDTKSKYRTESNEFSEWMSVTQYVENTSASENWYAQHKDDVRAKKIDYLVKWDKMLPSDKETLTLKASDGK